MEKHTAEANRNGEKVNICKLIPNGRFIFGRMRALVPFQTDQAQAPTPVMS
jgi:hypothetical protein